MSDKAQLDGSYAINAQLSDGTSLNLSGYLLAGMTIAERNHALDTAMVVVERQKKFAKLPELKARLDGIERHKEACIKQLESVRMANASRNGRIPSNRKDDEAKYQDQINQHNGEIATLRATVLSIESEIAGNKPPPAKLVA